MALSSNEPQQTVLHQEVSLKKMATFSEKKYKLQKMYEISSAICALLNSRGGKLEISCHEENARQVPVTHCVRMIEQYVTEMIGILKMAELTEIQVNQDEILINVKVSRKLVTVNYNLYLPSKCQVTVVPATTYMRGIVKILDRKITDNPVVIGSHHTVFEKGTKPGLQEDDDIQFKHLKDNTSKCVSLADRIVGKSNKLPLYVSGFANHRGGHIYYGISSEDVTVNGQRIEDKDRHEIKNKVAKTIKKMKWGRCEPQRGKQWEIFFEPVVDDDHNSIPSTFVIVIFIAPCPGGVFTEDPESYHIVEGQVKKMSLEIWWSNLTGVPLVTEDFLRPKWSSEKNREIFRVLTTKLVQYRNDHDVDGFEKLANLATKKFSGINVELIVLGERVIRACKRLHFTKAEILRKKIENDLTKSPDSFIFQVKMLNLKAMMERMQGNYEESYATSKEGLQATELAPVELSTIYFYEEASLITSIISATLGEHMIKQHALSYLKLAARNTMAKLNECTPSTMSDVHRELRIYKVLVHLSCCRADNAEQMKLTTVEDIKAAEIELGYIHQESVIEGRRLPHFWQITYDLAMCDLRRLQSAVLLQEDNNELLKEAFEFASKAQSLAKTHRFESAVRYAASRLRDLTVKLVGNALVGRKRPTDKRNFLGFQY